MHSDLLSGIIDLHLHTAPDLYPRKMNDLEIMEAGIRTGMRGVVIKSHHFPTAGRAALMNAWKLQNAYHDSDFTMYGSITLNQSVGGINPSAVEAALKLGARVVWLPTNTAENHMRKLHRCGGVACTENRKVVPNLLEVMKMIRDYDAVLQTGHIAPHECFTVVEQARKIGVKRIVITHPEFHIVNMSLEEQKQIVRDYDVFLEHEYSQPDPNGVFLSNLQSNLEAIRQIGAHRIILASDGGQAVNPFWTDLWAEMLNALKSIGVSDAELIQMCKENPAKVLGV